MRTKNIGPDGLFSNDKEFVVTLLRIYLDGTLIGRDNPLA